MIVQKNKNSRMVVLDEILQGNNNVEFFQLFASSIIFYLIY
jgi:hypothetical protein